MLFGVFEQHPLKPDIWIHINAGTLYLVIGCLIWHPKLPDQVCHYNRGTSTYPRCAHHQCVGPCLHLRSYQPVCLLEMLLYGVIGHVINVQNPAHYPVLLVCQQVLRDAIHAQDEFDVVLPQLGGVERGYLAADVQVRDHLLELRVGLLLQELSLDRVVLKVLVLIFHLKYTTIKTEGRKN